MAGFNKMSEETLKFFDVEVYKKEFHKLNNQFI